MRQSFASLAVALALALVTGYPVEAAPAVTVVNGPQGARVKVDGKLVCLLRTRNGSLSAEQRATRAANRLRKLIPMGLGPEHVEVRAKGTTWGVYAADELLMVATPGEAAERKETPVAVARRWAANLKRALQAEVIPIPSPFEPPATVAPEPPKKAPTLSVGTDSLAVPVGEKRTAPVLGTAQGAISARTDGAATAVVRPVPGKSAVEVRGLAPGKAVITVSRGGLESSFTVWVKNYAGRVSETPLLEVTGDPIPASMVQRMAGTRALDGVDRERGATVAITGAPTGARALSPGETGQVEIPITISGDAYLPVRTMARVRVRNVALASQDANVLLYSNDPESVREYGILYEGLFDSTGTARLLYHHQNRMGRPFMFQIHLINPADNPVDVQIVEATAGPVLDTIQVGHRAGERYMSVAARDIGYITRIPPRGSRLIYGVQMADLLTVSGIYNLRIIRGGPLVAHVSAEAEVSHPRVTSDLVAAARSEPDTYPSPQKDETYDYTVGQNWTFMPMGRKAIAGKIPNKKLFGNYGVLYNLTVNLNNPTDEEQTVRVVLSPEAGWTRGAFMIDGKLIEAPQIAPPGDAVLWTGKLAPQGRRQVRIQGIPVGGSSYPVSLVVRP